MKTADDLYWLVFVFGFVALFQLALITWCVAYTMRYVVKAAAATENISDTISRAWLTFEAKE